MKLSAILAPLIAAKVPHSVILETVQAWEAEQSDALEKRRASDRERQARKRSSHVMSRDTPVTGPSHDAGATRGENNLQTKILTGEEKKEKTGAAAPRGDLADFKSELSSILDTERIEALIAVRRKKGATMTANTGRLLVAAIRKCDMPPGEVADEMALRNWISVKPEWLAGRTAPRGHSPPRPQSVGEYFQQEARNAGLIDEPGDEISGRMETGDGGGQDFGSGGSRLVALPADFRRSG